MLPDEAKTQLKSEAPNISSYNNKFNREAINLKKNTTLAHRKHNHGRRKHVLSKEKEEHVCEEEPCTEHSEFYKKIENAIMGRYKPKLKKCGSGISL